MTVCVCKEKTNGVVLVYLCCVGGITYVHGILVVAVAVVDVVVAILLLY